MTDWQPLSVIQSLSHNQHNGSLIKTKLTPSKTSGGLSESQTIYKELLVKGKTAAAEGNLLESLDAYKKALKIKPTEKIEQRIKKIEDVLKEMEDDNEEFIELKNNLIIYRDLAERLYPHQIEGVQWMYDLQKFKKKGGILADDMGLGKTIQVISVLSAMFDMELIQHVLLVLPLSLIPNWQREFEKWAPGIKVKAFHGSVSERTRALDFVQRRPAVLMTTYGLVQTKWEQLGQTKLRQEFVWDYIILDEGHKIKNPSKTTKGLHAIPSKNRLILTGTPIQNNLRELWALFDWVMQGTLLGTQKTFRNEYELPITKARQRGASPAEIHLGNYMSESLRKIVDPYILRRTKGSVSAPKPSENPDEEQNVGNKHRPSFPKLKKKNDFVIWTYLSAVQEEIYRDFLDQDSIKELLASKRSPLVYLTILKKICDHPRLLPRRACHQLGLEANDSLHEDDFHTEKGQECAANRIDNISDETLVEESGKLQFLLELLKRLRDEGHRTLIFSLSRKMLNMIHRILLNNKFKVMRLDGTISKLSERELRVKKFQQDSSYDVFLLTTQVGGVGLTLTAADRVVIYDPSWNPATDAQAVDRIYRIGQEKNVVVYRLITCGTVEEKIYRRQIFKDSIIKQSTGDNKDPYRYFTNHDLKELFQIESTTESVTQRQLQDLHQEQRCLDPVLEEHLAYLHTLPMFGVSDHDLMFSQDPDDVDANDVMEEHRDIIRNKVAEAQNRVELEAQRFTGSEVPEQRWGGFDTEARVSEPRIKEVELSDSDSSFYEKPRSKHKENEPHFEIEGLYDKLDSLKVQENIVENIFNRSKISNLGGSDDEKDVKPAVERNNIVDNNSNINREAIHILDSDEEDIIHMDRAISDGDAILAADSPMKVGEVNASGDDQMGTLEVGESFLEESNVGMDTTSASNKDKQDAIPETPQTSMNQDQGLLDADISCIVSDQGRKSNFTGDSPNLSPEREIVAENIGNMETSTQNKSMEDEIVDDNEGLSEFNDNFIQDSAVYEDLIQPWSSNSYRALTPDLGQRSKDGSRAPTPALDHTESNDITHATTPGDDRPNDVPTTAGAAESGNSSRACTPLQLDESDAHMSTFKGAVEVDNTFKSGQSRLDNAEESFEEQPMNESMENNEEQNHLHLSQSPSKATEKRTSVLNSSTQSADLKLSLSESEDESFIEQNNRESRINNIEESDVETDVEMSDHENVEESPIHQRNAQDLSYILDGEESFQHQTNAKKSRVRLISESSGESEPADGETILSEDNETVESDGDSTDVDGFINDEEEEVEKVEGRKESLASFLQEEVISDFDSPWNSSESRKTKLKRRSTALPQRKLIESDESLNETDPKRYREASTIESSDNEDDDAENPMSLALSFQSDNEEDLF